MSFGLIYRLSYDQITIPRICRLPAVIDALVQANTNRFANAISLDIDRLGKKHPIHILSHKKGRGFARWFFEKSPYYPLVLNPLSRGAMLLFMANLDTVHISHKQGDSGIRIAARDLHEARALADRLITATGDQAKLHGLTEAQIDFAVRRARLTIHALAHEGFWWGFGEDGMQEKEGVYLQESDL